MNWMQRKSLILFFALVMTASSHAQQSSVGEIQIYAPVELDLYAANLTQCFFESPIQRHVIPKSVSNCQRRRESRGIPQEILNLMGPPQAIGVENRARVDQLRMATPMVMNDGRQVPLCQVITVNDDYGHGCPKTISLPTGSSVTMDGIDADEGFSLRFTIHHSDGTVRVARIECESSKVTTRDLEILFYGMRFNLPSKKTSKSFGF